MEGIFCGPIILRVRAEVFSTGPFPCTAIASAWRAAAWQSTKNWRKWGIKSEEKDIIRGALLHDYFLYDWHHHKHDRGLWNMHGFSHPRTALKNAGREYRLSPREQDIIKKHMWPLTIVPPLCREAWIVTAADKYCSFLETVEPRLKAVKHLGRLGRHSPAEAVAKKRSQRRRKTGNWQQKK